MSTSILILIVLTALGLVFGFVLAFANKKFAVEVNPLIHIVEDVLPKGQCGACGYAGCMAYAEAVVLNPDVPPNLCIPGKEPVAKAVAELTGKVAEAVEPRIARIKCAGTGDKAVKAYDYKGVEDCAAANLLINWQVPVCMIGTVGVLTWAFGGHNGLFTGDPFLHMIAGGLILGAFFMATDMVTIPITVKGQIVFAVGAGAITVLIRLLGGYPEGVCYAILLMNSVTPLIDRIIKPVKYGAGR